MGIEIEEFEFFSILCSSIFYLVFLIFLRDLLSLSVSPWLPLS